MEKSSFDQPVRIRLSKAGRWRTVTTVAEARVCLSSPDWPVRGPASEVAAKAMQGASFGVITGAEAREAFEEAALHAHILDILESVH